MSENNQAPESYNEEELGDIYAMLQELTKLDADENGSRAAEFLMKLSNDCRTHLQMYVLQEHGVPAADELYETLKRSPDLSGKPDPVTEWVDTLFKC